MTTRINVTVVEGQWPVKVSMHDSGGSGEGKILYKGQSEFFSVHTGTVAVVEKLPLMSKDDIAGLAAKQPLHAGEQVSSHEVLGVVVDPVPEPEPEPPKQEPEPEAKPVAE